MTLEDLLGHINPENPVVFLDTCSLLDIVRFPTRGNKASTINYYFEALANIINLAKENKIHVCITSEIITEYDRRFLQEKNIFKNWVGELKDNLTKASIFVNDLKHNLDSCEERVNKSLPDMCGWLKDNALELDMQTECKDKGFERSYSVIPPARRGQNQSDCIIYEHYILIAKELRERKHTGKIVFFTSNTNDYCCSDKSLKPEIENDFEEYSINFVLNWGQCQNAIK